MHNYDKNTIKINKTALPIRRSLEGKYCKTYWTSNFESGRSDEASNLDESLLLKVLKLFETILVKTAKIFNLELSQ